MGKALLVMVGVVLLVYALFDLRAADKSRVQGLSKIGWLLVILVPYFGPVLWMLFGQRKAAGPPPRPRYGPRPPRGPDDDPDYLRGL